MNKTLFSSTLDRPTVRDVFRLEAYDGWVCVTHTSSRQSEPVMDTVYWPTSTRSQEFKADYGDIFGEVLQQDRLGDGLFWFRSLRVQLRDGGSTKPIHTQTLNWDCPKVRKSTETEYRNGRWYKLLKRGWVEA